MQGSSFPLLFLCFPHIIREKYYPASAFIILSQIFPFPLHPGEAVGTSSSLLQLLSSVVRNTADERFFSARHCNGVISSMDASFPPRDPHNFEISFLTFLSPFSSFPSN